MDWSASRAQDTAKASLIAQEQSSKYASLLCCCPRFSALLIPTFPFSCSCTVCLYRYSSRCFLVTSSFITRCLFGSVSVDTSACVLTMAVQFIVLCRFPMHGIASGLTMSGDQWTAPGPLAVWMGIINSTSISSHSGGCCCCCCYFLPC